MTASAVYKGGTSCVEKPAAKKKLGNEEHLSRVWCRADRIECCCCCCCCCFLTLTDPLRIQLWSQDRRNQTNWPPSTPNQYFCAF